MDPNDFQRRITLVSLIAGIILLVSAGECTLLYASERFDKVPQHTSLGHNNPPRRTFVERKMEPLNSTDDECTDSDTQSHKGTSVRTKRSASPSNTGNERRKVRRISTEQGITTMDSSMERLETAINSLKDMVTVLTDALQRTIRSEALELEAKAMEAIKMDERFSDEDIKNAALVMSSNPSVANMYLHMKNKAARTKYLLHHMEQLKGYD